MENQKYEELKNNFFELCYLLDRYSVSKDYEALRKLHYSSIDWMNAAGIGEDYYKFFVEMLKQENQILKKEL